MRCRHAVPFGGRGAPPKREEDEPTDEQTAQTQADGKPDGRNVARMFREGWRPRALETVAEDYSPPTIKHGNQTVIGVEGMILCELPKAMAAKRRIAITKRTDAQMDAIDQNIMRVERPGRPIDRTFKSSVSVGKRASIADD